jgi:hypothetical protein
MPHHTAGCDTVKRYWLPMLRSAALLVGAPQVDESEISIPLVVSNIGRLHKRRVWEARHATGNRCGRWSALYRLGANIESASKPERLELYSSPPPFIGRHVGAAMGGYQQQVIDPLDDPGLARPGTEWSVA